MFITIRNLPLNVKTKDIQKLITEKCLIADVILGQITREQDTPTRKITIGLADECDAAIVFRKLNGLHLNGNPLILEDPRKNKGPVPGELPQVMITMPYQASAMHMQTQQMMIPGYNATTMATGFYNPMDPMMQPEVLEHQGMGYEQQPMMMNNHETILHQNPMSQPRHLINQPSHQLSQPRPKINQPRHQLNQPRHQMHQQLSRNNEAVRNRPESNQIMHQQAQVNQPRHQMHQQPSRNNEAVRNRPESNQRMHQQAQVNQPRHQMHQQASRRRPHEVSRNSYGNPHDQEPYVQNSAVNHQTALDWDIPSREVVFQESDPVWGIRVKKHSDMTSDDFQLENRRKERWDEPGLANQVDDNNFEQFAIDRQDINEDGYRYHEPSTHTEAYHPNDDNSFMIENYPRNVNPEYNSDAMPFNRPNHPVWEPYRRNDNFEINNRKRTYSETEHENYQYGDAYHRFEGQDNRSKRNKTDNYDNSYTSKDMEVGHHEPASARDFSHTYNESEIDNEFEEIATDGRPFLGFKKFRFSYKLPIAKFKQFEHYMFKNLQSTRFPTNVKAYNVMYSTCRLIMRKLINHLGNQKVRKYAYFVLNYIQLLIVKALGARLQNAKKWNHKFLYDAFHQNYTYSEFFEMFKKWFAFYDDNFDIEVIPKNLSNEPQATITKARPNVVPVTQKQQGSKPIYEGKAGSRPIRPGKSEELRPTFSSQGRSEVRPTPQNRPWSVAIAQGKPRVRVRKSNLKATPAYLAQQGKVKDNAQGKPNAPGEKKNLTPVETDPQKLEEMKAMEIVKRRTDTILSTPIDTANKLLQELRKQLNPELERVLQMEMEGINKTVFSCINISEKITLTNIRRKYSANFKRSLIYRLFNSHIALTAKITFAPDEKQPSLEACNEFFNSRQGRVLHVEQNEAMVLFSTNETFKKMCDEKDVEIEGCKILNIVPLDFDNSSEFHSAIENAIKTDNSEKIYDLVLNKSYIKGKLKKKEVVIMSDNEEEGDQPILKAELVKSETNVNNQTAEPDTNSTVKDIEKNKVEVDDINNIQPESEGNAVQNSSEPNTQIEETLNKKTDQISNIKTEPTSNIKTEETSKTETDQTPNKKPEEMSNSQTDEIQNIQFDQELSNEAQSGLPSPADDDGEDRDERIKEFLDDFEKAINENDEIFMSEDDLEDFDL